MSPRTPATLDSDLEAGLKRLKLAAVRRMAPEVLAAAKVQRWPPDELLRTLVEAEIAARDASNESTRRKAAGFPVTRRLEGLRAGRVLGAAATFDHLASLDWIEGAENVVLVGPAGTGKSHLLLGIGEAAVVSGRRVRYLPAATLVETLYGGLADNFVGRVIERLLRHDLVIIDDLGFAPLDDPGSDLLRGRRLRAPRSRGRVPLALRVLGSFPARAHHHGGAPRPTPPPRDHRRHIR